VTSIGFTGSREGMTIDQWAQVGMQIALQLNTRGPNEWHDGVCVGADTQAHQSMRTLDQPGEHKPDFAVKMHGHPCNLDKWRAHNEYDVTHAVKAPLVRNRVIVQLADVMIAAPKEYEEVLKGSGTWATIRYTRLRKKHLIIVWPDGTFEEERNPDDA